MDSDAVDWECLGALTGADVVAKPALVLLDAIARPSGNFEKTRSITHKPWRVHNIPGATQ